MTEALVEKPKKRRKKRVERTYTAEEVEKGLLAMAYWLGNTRKASAMLAEADPPLKIAPETLYYWKTNSRAQRYEEVRAGIAVKVMEKAAEEHSALAAKQMNVSREMTERMSRESHKISARELPGAIRNMTTSAAVHEDKADMLRGEPGRREAQRSATEVLRALAAKLGQDVSGALEQ